MIIEGILDIKGNFYYLLFDNKKYLILTDVINQYNLSLQDNGKHIKGKLNTVVNRIVELY